MPTITQAGVVTTVQTNVLATSYSFVAAYANTGIAGTPVHTVNIGTHNVGNLIVSLLAVDFSTASPTLTPTAPSGTGTGSWADSGEAGWVNAGANVAMSIWTGKVTSVQASTTLTVPYTTTGTLGPSVLAVLEFTCPGVDSGTTWSVDAHGHSAQGSVTTVSYPGLTPSVGNPELYVGHDYTLLGTPTAGATPGCFYINATSNDLLVYNSTVSAPLGPTAPTSGGTSYSSQAILAYARTALAQLDNIVITLQPVPTGRMWIISQIGFEFLPSNTLQTITCDIILNNRIIKPGVNPNAGQFQGPPYVTVRAGDVMTINFKGAPVGTSAIANFLYNEYSAYAQAHELGGVV